MYLCIIRRQHFFFIHRRRSQVHIRLSIRDSIYHPDGHITISAQVEINPTARVIHSIFFVCCSAASARSKLFPFCNMAGWHRERNKAAAARRGPQRLFFFVQKSLQTRQTSKGVMGFFSSDKERAHPCDASE
jgi:hypothetical protein